MEVRAVIAQWLIEIQRQIGECNDRVTRVEEARRFADAERRALFAQLAGRAPVLRSSDAEPASAREDPAEPPCSQFRAEAVRSWTMTARLMVLALPLL